MGAFMIRHVARCCVLCIVVLVLVGCGKSPEQRSADDTAQKLTDAGKKLDEAGKKLEEAANEGGAALGDALKKMGEAMSSPVEPVDFRELKALLPDSLPGLKRTDAGGQRSVAFGLSVSKAEGHYRSEPGASIDITITDMGSLKGLTAMATFGWTVVEMDRETDSGYEKTTNYAGYKAHETYDKRGPSGKLEVLVANRFVVEVAGTHTGMEVLKGALGQIDLRKLEGLKMRGVQSSTMKSAGRIV
jgi:hypothetical protein